MFLMDAIAPIVNRVLRKLGIREGQIRGKQVLGIAEEYSFDVDEETGVGNVWIDDQGLVLEKGKTYEVVVDGKSYHCQADDYFGMGYFLGSKEQTYSDYPFHINGDKSTIDLYVKGTETTHTVDVYEVTETITPIDPKYLPGVCLPVVEISQETLATDISSGAAEIKPNECDQLEAAYAAGLPCVFVSRISDDEFSVTVSNISPLSFVIAANIVVPFYSFSDGFLGERRFYRGVDNVWRMSKSE